MLDINPVEISSIAQVITAVVIALAQILNLWQAWHNGRVLKDVREQTNGINDHLVKVTGEAEHAKGMIQGAQEQRDSGDSPKG